MPRSSRIVPRSGYMHIVARGVNQQDIFFENNDYDRFISYMKALKDVHHIKVLAYCLMTNHIHLLIHQEEPTSSSFMHDLLTRYVMYYNKKYGRSGHLFQNRFTSRAIETQKYLMICLRYIHNNPVKAGIAAVDSYPWSSYSTYCTLLAAADKGQAPVGNNDALCDAQIIAELFNDREDFVDFHRQRNLPSEMALEYFENHNEPPDSEVKEVICYFLKSDDPSSIQSLDCEKRNEIIEKLRTIGIKNLQITRITGLTGSLITHRKRPMHRAAD